MPLYNLPEALLLRVKRALSLSTPEEIAKAEERISICRSCSELKLNEEGIFKIETCSLCKCILSLKTLVPTEKCKDNKW